MAANYKQKTAIVITILSFLGVGLAYLGMLLKNDSLYWIGMFLALPLYLFVTFLALKIIWACRPKRSKKAEDESIQSEKQASLIEDIGLFYGTKGLGVFMAVILYVGFAEPAENNTILGFIAALFIFSGFLMIFFFGGGFSFGQYRSGQYTGLNWYFKWANVAGSMLCVLGFFFFLIEYYLLPVLVILSER